MQRGWSGVWRMALWPALTVALLTALWSVRALRGEEERQRTEAAALADAGAAAEAYEQFVTRSVAHMDQVSMQLKQSWEQSGATLDLHAMRRDGMFLDPAFACVAILDRDGALRGAIGVAGCGADPGAAEWFAYHRNNNTSALRIGPPQGAPTSAHATILMSRRLDGADHEFGGVVLLAVRASYLTTFYLPSTLGRGGRLATVGAESGLRVEQQGPPRVAALDTAFPFDAGLWAAPAGALVVAQGFPERRPFLLGWRRSPVYPVVALVAMPQGQAMAPWAAWHAASLNWALAASAIVLVLGAAATAGARGALRRQRQRDAERAALDAGERAAYAAELQRIANEDSLTRLPNRQWMQQVLPGRLERALAEGAEVALLLINLDDFKHINDAHGQAGGDLVLRSAAQRLRSLLRPADCLVRFGGDEFLVLLMPADNGQHTERVAARIVAAFEAPFYRDRERLLVGASVGISVFPGDAADAAELVRVGGIALDAAKAEGKGQFRFYEPALAQSVQARVQLRHSLLEAIAREQFVLYYQPRVDTMTGELRSVEALLRWRHPQRGLVSPLDFIPLAEASGLILPIGAIVMQLACTQIAAWRAAGLPLVPVSINVSPRQFARGDVARQLGTCLERSAIPSSLLEVEITESAMMGEHEHIPAQLAALRALGVKLHLDDFGTGYSSLSQLQKLHMDVLKVDRAFTAELDSSREGKVFFQAIVSMAHALGMAVVAEGVETAAQLRMLQELACDEVQGYLVARPLPAPDMAELMRRRFLFPGPPRGVRTF